MTGTKFTTRRWYLSARSRRKGLIALAFLLPGIIYYIMFRYAPMWGNLIAFQDFNPYMVVSILPLLVAFPFVQKFFVKGVMIGAIKG